MTPLSLDSVRGSAIARIVGQTVKKYPDEFERIVKMWVYEERVGGQKLSEIINTRHENVKYLPGKIIPDNIKAFPDLIESVHDADVLIFVVPHQFVKGICGRMSGKIKSKAIGLSVIKTLALCSYNDLRGNEQTRPLRSSHLGIWNQINDENSASSKTKEKGLATGEDGNIKLISELIQEILDINVSVLMGANLAGEVAAEHFCEATIGTSNAQHGAILKKLFQTDNFRIGVVTDARTVELCGALKNIVACGAGFTDGLGYGNNTKAAVIRLGLLEMTKFIQYFYPGSNLGTLFESCGIADLVTTCYGGRNRKVCEAFVRTGKRIEVLEQELLNGQILQGPHTAAQVYFMLQTHNMEEKFPLFSSIHRICSSQVKPNQIIDCLRHHPENFLFGGTV